MRRNWTSVRPSSVFVDDELAGGVGVRREGFAGVLHYGFVIGGELSAVSGRGVGRNEDCPYRPSWFSLPPRPGA